MRRPPRIGLQWKLTVAVVLIVMMPLVASAILIDQIGKVGANFGATAARESARALEPVTRVYRDLVLTMKELQLEVAQRIASRPGLETATKEELQNIVDSEAKLRAIAVLRPDGSVAAEAAKSLEEGPGWRDAVVDHRLPSGVTLHLTFQVIDTQAEMTKLQQSLERAKVVAGTRTSIPNALQTTFLVVMALAALAALGFGLFAGSVVTRRIAALVTTARSVSDGHLDARVQLRGTDEMAELGSAFNTMLDDLEHARGQLEYLQRMGVWQDVARKLAHEIKNPLTPIQLAVQQTVSTYKGDDARFKAQLTETREIVEEEIAGLRRLVDTFRTLGQLPKVEKAPIALAELLEELKLDPAFATKLELRAPPAPVTVRADKLLLKRVLANLVENAVHAGVEAGNEGKVVIGWRAERDMVAITIDDHGKGVPDTERDKIFEPYVTTKSTGTGLGLAIARKIAIEHGGELSLAAKRAPTGGARFIVSLPLRGPEASLP